MNRCQSLLLAIVTLSAIAAVHAQNGWPQLNYNGGQTRHSLTASGPPTVPRKVACALAAPPVTIEASGVAQFVVGSDNWSYVLYVGGVPTLIAYDPVHCAAQFSFAFQLPEPFTRPAIALSDDGSSLIYTTANGIFGVDSHSGKSKWSLALPITGDLILDAGIAWIMGAPPSDDSTDAAAVGGRAYGLDQRDGRVFFNITTVPSASTLIAIMPGGDVTSPILFVTNQTGGGATNMYAVGVGGNVLWWTWLISDVVPNLVCDAVSNLVFTFGVIGSGIAAYSVGDVGVNSPLWTFGTGNTYDALAVLDSGDLLVSSAASVVALNPMTGAQLWYSPAPAPIPPDPQSLSHTTSLVVDMNDIVYYTTTAGTAFVTVTALNSSWAPEAGVLSPLWSSEVSDTVGDGGEVGTALSGSTGGWLWVVTLLAESPGNFPYVFAVSS